MDQKWINITNNSVDILSLNIKLIILCYSMSCKHNVGQYQIQARDSSRSGELGSRAANHKPGSGTLLLYIRHLITFPRIYSIHHHHHHRIF